MSGRPEDVYIGDPDLEDFENYTTGGFHPTILGDTFQNNRYRVVHKLGHGSYSTVWLAHDQESDRYVALKILGAWDFATSKEADILQRLQSPDAPIIGQEFIPRLLDHFTIEGPNGRHICVVLEPQGCNIACAKDCSVDRLFPAETARSIAAQVIMGLAFLHSRGICHGDLYLMNILLRGSNLDNLEPHELYKRFRLYKIPVERVDGAPIDEHAPRYGLEAMQIIISADKLVDPIVTISDFGTSFDVATEPSPKLCTPPYFLPPEHYFKEQITLAADIWTLGVNLYEIMGTGMLFFPYAREKMLADMIGALGPLPSRWWNIWEERGEFFEQDGSWKQDAVYDGFARPLHDRMWNMGRGKTLETCEWDVQAGELRALEDLLRGMLTFDPAERLTAEQMMASEYFVKFAMPAWERQQERAKAQTALAQSDETVSTGPQDGSEI